MRLALFTSPDGAIDRRDAGPLLMAPFGLGDGAAPPPTRRFPTRLRATVRRAGPSLDPRQTDVRDK